MLWERQQWGCIYIIGIAGIVLRSRGEVELLVKAILCDNASWYDAKQMGYQSDSSYENFSDWEWQSTIMNISVVWKSFEKCN